MYVRIFRIIIDLDIEVSSFSSILFFVPICGVPRLDLPWCWCVLRLDLDLDCGVGVCWGLLVGILCSTVCVCGYFFLWRLAFVHNYASSMDYIV